MLQVQALQMRRDALANNLKNKQDDLERVEVIDQIILNICSREFFAACKFAVRTPLRMADECWETIMLGDNHA